jgi:acyl carrier protein
MAPDRAILLSILLSTLPSAAQANVSDSAPPYLPPESYRTAGDRTPDGWTLVSDETQRSRIASKVTAIVARILGVETEHVTESADLVADLGADSLDAVELMMTLEEEFGVEIRDDMCESAHSVKDVIDLIARLTS